MSEPGADEVGARLRSELGLQRWEAIGHYLSDGDFLGLNLRDYQGAIKEYQNAWNLLSTPWQRQVCGADILAGIAEFALQSRDPKLASEILGTLLCYAESTNNESLQSAYEALSELARNAPGTISPCS